VLTLRELRLLLQDAERRLGPSAVVSISPDGVNTFEPAFLTKQGCQELPQLLLLPLDAAAPDRKLQRVKHTPPATLARDDVKASLGEKIAP
jgi:hypothetical protein